MLNVVLRLTVALLLVAAGEAGGRSLAIDNFDSTVTVLPDGSIAVVETIAARFSGSWNGIYRTIPIEYRTPQGLNYTLRLTIDSVADSMGSSLRYESSRERHYRKIKIWVPSAEDTTRTIKISYHVANALRFFDEHDELYWNVTGDEWDVPIGAASATILLPAAVTGVRATAFRGAYGSTDRNEVAISGRMVTVRTTGLGLHEGLTAVAGWNPGVVYRPTKLESAGDLLYDNWQLALPVGVFLLMWLVWLVRGRDPKPETVVTLYEPPSGMSPAEAGTLADGSVDMRDITATIVDLAVRGYLRIEEENGQYRFTRLKSKKESQDLETHESLLLEGIFQTSDHVSALDLKDEFYTNLPDIKESLYANLVDQDFYTKRPNEIGAGYALLGTGVFLFPVAWAFLSLKADGAFGFPSWATIGSCLATAIILLIFATIMPRRTKTGTREYAKLLGFQEFLSRVDADRLQRLVKTPEMFEKYLPYAMALGVETEWANAFHDIYRQPPSWYVGGAPVGTFNASLFTTQMHRMSSEVGTALRSAPRGSGGSGFGDSSGTGGFSGGGVGGGGGGGF